jgi:ABC-type multidrug transport system fused ATPase/permease subunit
MKEFLQVLRRFLPPYKKYLVLTIVFNILSAVLNIFSFAALIPILQILFQVDGGLRANDLMPWSLNKEVLQNNMSYYVQQMIIEHLCHDDAACHRPLPRLHDIPQDNSLLPLVSQRHADPNRRGERYTQSALPQDNIALIVVLQ